MYVDTVEPSWAVQVTAIELVPTERLIEAESLPEAVITFFTRSVEKLSWTTAFTTVLVTALSTVNEYVRRLDEKVGERSPADTRNEDNVDVDAI